MTISLCVQAEEGQRGIRAHVRGGSHRHQELSPHQRSSVGAGGQVHRRGQTRAPEPLQQV